MFLCNKLLQNLVTHVACDFRGSQAELSWVVLILAGFSWSAAGWLDFSASGGIKWILVWGEGFVSALLMMFNPPTGLILMGIVGVQERKK